MAARQGPNIFSLKRGQTETGLGRERLERGGQRGKEVAAWAMETGKRGAREACFKLLQFCISHHENGIGFHCPDLMGDSIGAALVSGQMRDNRKPGRGLASARLWLGAGWLHSLWWQTSSGGGHLTPGVQVDHRVLRGPDETMTSSGRQSVCLLVCFSVPLHPPPHCVRSPTQCSGKRGGPKMSREVGLSFCVEMCDELVPWCAFRLSFISIILLETWIICIHIELVSSGIPVSHCCDFHLVTAWAEAVMVLCLLKCPL